MNFDLLVDGITDEAVGRKILETTGHSFGICFGRRGCAFIYRKIAGYSQRARYGSPLLTLVDLMDFDHACAPTLAKALLPDRPALAVVGIVVRELESWLLADKQGIANLLGISVALVPDNPEGLADPKKALVNLAKRSRRTRIRNALVPQAGTSASVGPGYAMEIVRFVAESWDVGRARLAAPSLDRCLRRLQEIASKP